METLHSPSLAPLSTTQWRAEQPQPAKTTRTGEALARAPVDRDVHSAERAAADQRAELVELRKVGAEAKLLNQRLAAALLRAAALLLLRRRQSRSGSGGTASTAATRRVVEPRGHVARAAAGAAAAGARASGRGRH